MGGPAIMRGLDADKYDRQYSDRYLFKRIFSYFGAYSRQSWITLATFAVLAIILAVQPLLIAEGVNALDDAGNNLPQIVLAVLFVAAFLQYGANWLRRRLLTFIIGNVVAQMRKDAVAAAIERDLAFYDENSTGKIVSRITSDTQEFGDIVMVSSDIISQMLQLVILTVLMFDRSILLTLLLLGLSPVVIAAAIGFRNMARHVTRQASRQLAVVNSIIQESVSGISIAKNFRKEAMIYDEFAVVNSA